MKVGSRVGQRFLLCFSWVGREHLPSGYSSFFSGRIAKISRSSAVADCKALMMLHLSSLVYHGFIGHMPKRLCLSCAYEVVWSNKSRSLGSTEALPSHLAEDLRSGPALN